jgi:hypothetical protein
VAAIDTSTPETCRRSTCCPQDDLDHVSTGDGNCPSGYIWNGFECVPADCVVLTTELPDGMVDVPYMASVTVDSDLPNADFLLIAGAMPDGLTLNPDGTITGTPTTAGTFEFTVRADPSA